MGENGLIKHNLISALDSLSAEDKTALIQKWQSEKIGQLVDHVKEFESKIGEVNETVFNMKEDLDNLLHKTNRLESYREDTEYLSASSLARMHNPSFSGKRMNLLLKACSIIHKTSGEPYAQFLSGKEPMAIKTKEVTTNGMYEYYVWRYHKERIWKTIESRLEERKLLSRFYACTTKDEMDNFIESI